MKRIFLAVAMLIPWVARAQTGTCPLQATVCTGQTLSMSSTSNVFIIPTVGYGTVRVTFAGLTAAGGAITPSGSVDGTNYVAGGGFTTPAGATTATATADGQYIFTIGAARFVRLAVTSTGSGTVTLGYTLYQGTSGGSSGGGGGGTVTQGAGSNSNAWTTIGPTLTWQGTLTVAAATSTPFSSTTADVGTIPATAAALTYIVAINQGANPVTVCFQGGTCTATTGIIIPVGGFKANPLPGTALPSFYSTSGTIVSLSNG